MLKIAFLTIGVAAIGWQSGYITLGTSPDVFGAE